VGKLQRETGLAENFAKINECDGYSNSEYIIFLLSYSTHKYRERTNINGSSFEYNVAASIFVFCKCSTTAYVANDLWFCLCISGTIKKSIRHHYLQYYYYQTPKR
jgi:hypothetical protein